MAEIGERLIADTPGAGFAERHVDADGFRIRYLAAGQGPPLVHLHGAGDPRLSRAHDRLVARFRVIAFEVPGFDESPENQRSGSMPELASSWRPLPTDAARHTRARAATAQRGRAARGGSAGAPLHRPSHASTRCRRLETHRARGARASVLGRSPPRRARAQGSPRRNPPLRPNIWIGHHGAGQGDQRSARALGMPRSTRRRRRARDEETWPTIASGTDAGQPFAVRSPWRGGQSKPSPVTLPQRGNELKPSRTRTRNPGRAATSGASTASSARCAPITAGSAARSNTRRRRATIVGNAESRGNWIDARSVFPSPGRTDTVPRTPEISIARAYPSPDTASSPGIARAPRKASIAGQSYGGDSMKQDRHLSVRCGQASGAPAAKGARRAAEELLKGLVEPADTAEARGERNLRHRQPRLMDQLLGQ